MLDTSRSFLSSTAASGDQSFTMPRRPNDGTMDWQLSISSTASVTMYGRISPDQAWVQLATSPYTASTIAATRWVPYVRLVWTSNTGTVAFDVWAI